MGKTPDKKLETYREKRDFRRTGEPAGDATDADAAPDSADGPPRFVIQKHQASRLHYDLRLEVDGVLKSWAVPKGPSTNPRDKRLAVAVEDHPLDYADFEGTIPEGEYGAGTVLVWDRGTYRNLMAEKDEPVGMAEALEAGHAEIALDGEKLGGGYALVRTRLGGDPRNWLLIKMKDSSADPDADPVADRPESVLSGRTLEEIAADG